MLKKSLVKAASLGIIAVLADASIVSSPFHVIPALAACNILTNPFSSGNWLTGFNGSQPNVQGVRADIEAYNPSPIYQASTAWVMLQSTPPTNWAQIGWVKWAGDSNSYIFLQ
jgi:hypothetical protein